MVFHKRDDHVIEMQQSNKWTQDESEACKPGFFDPHVAPYTTFISKFRKILLLRRIIILDYKYKRRALLTFECSSRRDLKIGILEEEKIRALLTQTRPPVRSLGGGRSSRIIIFLPQDVSLLPLSLVFPVKARAPTLQYTCV